MDIIDRMHHRILGSLLQGRVRALQSHVIDKIRAWKTPLSISCLLLSSAAFGSWAYHIAKNEAYLSWERSRTPSEKVWIHALGTLGWKKLEKTGLIQKAMRTLPTQFDEKDSTWISDDSRWLIVFHHPDSATSASIYCESESCKEPAQKWAPLGIGWVAFDEAMKRAKPSERPSLPKKNSNAFWDPRAIRY